MKGIKRFKTYKLKKINIYICVCVWERERERERDYKREKYKRKMCYHQKNNSNVKTFEKPKNIKESDDLLFRNYWNKTKYI